MPSAPSGKPGDGPPRDDDDPKSKWDNNDSDERRPINHRDNKEQQGIYGTKTHQDNKKKLGIYGVMRAFPTNKSFERN